jgi:hypothetical protein
MRDSLAVDRFHLIVPLLASSFWLLVGCGGSTHEPSGCVSDGQYNHVVSLDDTTLGFAALDAVAAFAGNGDGVLHWFDGSQTILHITADASQGTVSINSPPLDPKYCAPSMNISNVTFTSATDDGRLAETMVSSLTAIGRGTPTAVWPDLAVLMDKQQGSLQLPAEWTSGFEIGSVKLLVNSKIDTHSPYCRPGEKPDLSTTSTSECTSWDGKMISWGHPTGDPQTAPTVTVNHVVGWWTWQ